MRYRRCFRSALAGPLIAATAGLWLACGGEPMGPETGVLEVTTTTTGEEPDPDGYLVVVNGVEVQAIGPAATITLPGLAPGPHLVGLTGVASNCRIQGGSPRGTTVIVGATTVEAFSITCTESPPVVGSLSIGTSTSGPSPDPDGYTVLLDGDPARPIATDGNITVSDLAPGVHPVELTGLAAQCTVTGDNPLMATVPAGDTGEATFAVVCAATAGSLEVTIDGLPGGTDATVSVTGPGGYSEQLTAGATLEGLLPGEYSVTAANVPVGGDTYGSRPPGITAEVTAGATAQVTVTYELLPTLNLRIGGLYITQSVQAFDNEVPLVAGRDGFLRVFVLANEANTAAPTVRVRLYQGATLVETFILDAPGASTPLAVDEGALAGSWNVALPASLIQPGLRFLADVDHSEEIPELDESDNHLPQGGTPRQVEVRTVPAVAITFVPVLQTANGLEGSVAAGSVDEYLELARRIYPFSSDDATVHSVVSTTGPLQQDDANGAWGALLSELVALRLAEGTGRLYYGVVRLGYTGGQIARGMTGTPVAIGTDALAQRSRMTAHELGHMWGRDHAPCGNPQDLDPDYPYAGGQIGMYGFDVAAGTLKPPTTSDIMGLCQGPWISDYTYSGVMSFRGSASGMVPVTGSPRPSLLVWGRIENGQAVLEPAFHLVTRPELPRRPGPYSIEGATNGGGVAFRLSFDPAPAADDPRGTRPFAFAVPLDQSAAGRLESIRLTGPGVGVAAVMRATASLEVAGSPEIASLSQSPRGLELRWNAAAHPVVLVRDPGTGEVLSFGRGGRIELPAGRSEVDVTWSDGVRSRQARVRLSAP